MKITVYTIKDCAFSKQEKEYLTANKLTFEEKDLETNKDFLTEMLAISNNFAGTPVTRIEKDDGTITVLKGFTKEEFDTTFGLAPIPASPTETTDKPVEAPTPVTPTVDTAPKAADVPTAEVPSIVEEPTTATVPNETPIEDKDLSSEVTDPLQSVMDSLKSKTETTTPAAPVQTTEEPVAPPMPTDSSAPTIPDFPAK